MPLIPFTLAWIVGIWGASDIALPSVALGVASGLTLIAAISFRSHLQPRWFFVLALAAILGALGFNLAQPHFNSSSLPVLFRYGGDAITHRLRSPIMLSLRAIELRIAPALREQRLMRPALDDAPLFHHVNAIGHLHRRKTVTGEDRAAPIEQRAKFSKQFRFRQRVERTGRLVENDDARAAPNVTG
jgi:hypothetical protein